MPDRDHYAVLGVAPTAAADELLAAYRSAARRHHPDLSPDHSDAEMAEVNAAWEVLSDRERRTAYDRAAGHAQPTSIIDSHRTAPTSPPTRRVGERRDQWVAGVRAQVLLLGRQAGRSATMTLLVRRKRAERSVYDDVVERLLVDIGEDTAERIRRARSAGVAPLDLGVATTLVGIGDLARRIGASTTRGVTLSQLLAAELLDRMWDVLAHELPVGVTSGLGGNPGVGRQLSDRVAAGGLIESMPES